MNLLAISSNRAVKGVLLMRCGFPSEWVNKLIKSSVTPMEILSLRWKVRTLRRKASSHSDGNPHVLRRKITPHRSAYEQIWAHFSLPYREREDERYYEQAEGASLGVLYGNAYYRLPGWPGRCVIIFPTRVNRAPVALMEYESEGAQYRAQAVRFSPDGSRCSQSVLRSATAEGLLAHALFRYRFGTTISSVLHHRLRWRLPSFLAVPLRWVGGVLGILFAFFFQLAVVVVLLGTMGEQEPPSSGVAAAFFPLFGILGTAIVLLPTYAPRLAAGPPFYRGKQLQSWLTVLLLAGEYGAFLYAIILSGHLWNASSLVVAGVFLWLTLTPVFAGAEIGRLFHGSQVPEQGEKTAEIK